MYLKGEDSRGKAFPLDYVTKYSPQQTNAKPKSLIENLASIRQCDVYTNDVNSLNSVILIKTDPGTPTQRKTRNM